MATIYFTNNADSGDGSLREAWTNAVDGDVIMPDPTAFALTDTIEVLLASAWSFRAANVTLDGGTKRIILNGQNAARVGTGASASIENAFRNVDFKNFSYTGTGSTAAQYPVYISGLGSLTFTNCQFYGNQCASGATSAFIRTTNLSSASIVLNNCVAYDNGTTATARFIQANTGTFEVNGCTLISRVYGTNLVSNDSILSSDSDFANAGFVDASSDDYRLTLSSPYLTGGTLTGTDYLGHTRSGSKGAFDGSWVVCVDEDIIYFSENTTIDYLIVEQYSTINLIGANRFLSVRKEATIEDDSSILSDTNGYLALPANFDVDSLSAILDNISLATYGAGVTSVSASVNERTVTLSVTKTNNIPVTCIEWLSYGEGEEWIYTGDSDSITTFQSYSDKAFWIKVFDGISFTTSNLVSRTYYYRGSATSGSFAESVDWAMNASKSMICNDEPTIEGSTFNCL